MIRKAKNSNVRIISFGEGTTYIGKIFPKSGINSMGLLFSDHRDGLLHGDEVILEFKQQSDVAEFIKEVLDLFEKSEGDSMEASIKKLLGSL